MSTGGVALQYERLVLSLRSRVAAMRLESLSAEAIARAMHAERRRLAAEFKERTPEPLRSQIYRRTLAVYGDPLGPTVEQLRAKGRSWEDIIESAARPGRPIPLDGGPSRAGSELR